MCTSYSRTGVSCNPFFNCIVCVFLISCNTTWLLHCISAQPHPHTHTHTPSHPPTHMHAHTHAHTHTHTHTRTCIHTHAHTHTHTRTLTHTCIHTQCALHRIPSPESADIELMVLADYVSESVEGLQQRLEVGSGWGYQSFGNIC